jgi:hypothetical protein
MAYGVGGVTPAYGPASRGTPGSRRVEELTSGPLAWAPGLAHPGGVDPSRPLRPSAGSRRVAQSDRHGPGFQAAGARVAG